MANKETSNFKQALNELLAGKITTDEPAKAEPKKAETKKAEPIKADKKPAQKADTSDRFKDDISAAVLSAIDSGAQEETTICKNVIIEGNVRTTGKLTIAGEITGNVVSTADLIITGKVGGSIQADNIKLNQCVINDTVTVAKELYISADSVVNGDIAANSVICCGAINGNVKADSVTLEDSSKTVGDISCKKISISEGACLKGKLETI